MLCRLEHVDTTVQLTKKYDLMNHELLSVEFLQADTVAFPFNICTFHVVILSDAHHTHYMKNIIFQKINWIHKCLISNKLPTFYYSFSSLTIYRYTSTGGAEGLAVVKARHGHFIVYN